MDFGLFFLRGLDARQRSKAFLLGAWFFVTVATLWLLKPVRVAALLSHFGAEETPYVRLAGVVAIGVAVSAYSILVSRSSRLDVVRYGFASFAALLVVFWTASKVGGDALTSQRAYVWSIYVLVEIYAVMGIGVFWTYTNDVVSADEAKQMYGFIGLGGIAGGLAGGAFVDLFASAIGPTNLLLVCMMLALGSVAFATKIENTFRPPVRHPSLRPGVSAAFEGAREVRRSRYLMLIVAIVVAYEFTATLTDFGINVVFEHTYQNQLDLTRMYGRLGWIVSAAAAIGQVVLVPILLPSKRLALIVPPLVMIAGAVGVVILPVITTAIVLAAADRGLNYSIQQATKESLYIPLSDGQKYKAKAFIDMFVDRAARAVAALVLIFIVQAIGTSVRVSLIISFASMFFWLGSARRLGALESPSEEATSNQPSPAPAKLDASLHLP